MRTSLALLVALAALASRAAAQDDASLADAPIDNLGADALGTPAAPPGYETDTTVDERIARLDEVLGAHARSARGGREEGGILNLIVGGVVAGAGITVLALDERSNPLLFVLGGLSIALGVGSISTGIIGLATDTAAERRYRSFVRDRAASPSARLVGRYEGALWAESEAAADARWLGIAGAVLIGANGGVELAFTALFAPDDYFRVFGYSLGGVYVALAVLELILAFGETDAERRFREYEESTPSVSLAPWGSGTAGGLSLTGAF